MAFTSDKFTGEIRGQEREQLARDARREESRQQHPSSQQQEVKGND